MSNPEIHIVLVRIKNDHCVLSVIVFPLIEEVNFKFLCLISRSNVREQTRFVFIHLFRYLNSNSRMHTNVNNDQIQFPKPKATGKFMFAVCTKGPIICLSICHLVWPHRSPFPGRGSNSVLSVSCRWRQ